MRNRDLGRPGAPLSIVLFCKALRKEAQSLAKATGHAIRRGWETDFQIGPPSRLKGRFVRIQPGEKYTEPKAKDFFTISSLARKIHEKVTAAP